MFSARTRSRSSEIRVHRRPIHPSPPPSCPPRAAAIRSTESKVSASRLKPDGASKVAASEGDCGTASRWKRGVIPLVPQWLFGKSVNSQFTAPSGSPRRADVIASSGKIPPPGLAQVPIGLDGAHRLAHRLGADHIAADHPCRHQERGMVAVQARLVERVRLAQGRRDLLPEVRQVAGRQIGRRRASAAAQVSSKRGPHAGSRASPLALAPGLRRLQTQRKERDFERRVSRRERVVDFLHRNNRGP